MNDLLFAKQKILVDEVSENEIYVGISEPWRATSDAVWQIKKITTSWTITRVEFANWTLDFNKIRDNRTTYSYS